MQKLNKMEKKIAQVEELNKLFEKNDIENKLQYEAFQAVIFRISGIVLTPNQLKLLERVKREPDRFMLASILYRDDIDSNDESDEELTE